MDTKTLKGLILQKFYTISAFADSVGWSRNKASRIINGLQEPSIPDIVAICEALDLTEKEFFDIFFIQLSTMCTQS